MKNTKWSQKGLKIDDVALNGAFWTHKKSEKESLKNLFFSKVIHKLVIHTNLKEFKFKLFKFEN